MIKFSPQPRNPVLGFPSCAVGLAASHAPDLGERIVHNANTASRTALAKANTATCFRRRKVFIAVLMFSEYENHHNCFKSSKNANPGRCTHAYHASLLISVSLYERRNAFKITKQIQFPQTHPFFLQSPWRQPCKEFERIALLVQLRLTRFCRRKLDVKDAFETLSAGGWVSSDCRVESRPPERKHQSINYSELVHLPKNCTGCEWGASAVTSLSHERQICDLKDF